jgi:RNase P subunit RPR2
MATDVQVRPIHTLAAAAKGAQCPNCFTFNMPHHLPEHRKQQSSSGMELTCALCGTRYPAQMPSKAA